jgi:hypothetical protein
MTEQVIEPIRPRDFACDGEPQVMPPCCCAERSLLERLSARWFSEPMEGFGRDAPPAPPYDAMPGPAWMAAGPVPRLWLTFLRSEVQLLDDVIARDGWPNFWHVLGVFAWQQSCVASIGVKVIDSGVPTIRLVRGEVNVPSAYLDKPWQVGGRVRIARALPGVQPWGLNTILQVLDHETRHWMGSLYGARERDQHTPDPRDLMGRQPHPRSMWTPYDPRYGIYFGRSLRELNWERSAIGPPLTAA